MCLVEVQVQGGNCGKLLPCRVVVNGSSTANLLDFLRRRIHPAQIHPKRSNSASRFATCDSEDAPLFARKIHIRYVQTKSVFGCDIVQI